MKGAMSETQQVKQRAELFRYVSLEIDESTLLATYELDGRRFVESVTFDGIAPRRQPGGDGPRRVVVPPRGDSRTTRPGPPDGSIWATRRSVAKGRALLEAALREGLGSSPTATIFRSIDVTIVGGTESSTSTVAFDAHRVLVPFGGGIDSVVTTSQLSARSTRPYLS